MTSEFAVVSLKPAEHQPAPSHRGSSARAVVLRALTRRPQTLTWQNSTPHRYHGNEKNWMSSESYIFCHDRAEHVIFERWCFIHYSSSLLATPGTPRPQISAATLRKLPSDSILGRDNAFENLGPRVRPYQWNWQIPTCFNCKSESEPCVYAKKETETFHNNLQRTCTKK